MRTIFNKHKYIKVYSYHENKTLTIEYHKIADFKPSYLIHPDHVFNSSGYQTIMIADTSAETINPLDFESKYNVKDFQSAIQSKLIRETFGILEGGKLDIVKVLLFVNVGINILLIYILLKNSGVLNG